MKLLEIEKTNRLYEIKSKNDKLFKEQKFLIKNYAIKIFAGVATTAAGVIIVPYVMNPTGLVHFLTDKFRTHFSKHITPRCNRSFKRRKLSNRNSVHLRI